jgi:hypothetical protein
LNFLGHTHVALASGEDDPRYLLGAVLPDLASMAHVRLDRGSVQGELHRGVRCHIETDAVFHALPAFRHGSSAIRQQLVERGMRRGAARAVGHLGWELLLDGTLVETTTEQAFRSALAEAAAEATTTAIAPEGQERWMTFLARWHQRPEPRLHYDDPEWVAQRLMYALAPRPRLAFGSDDLTTVTEVLEEHAAEVVSAAPATLDATATAWLAGTGSVGGDGVA